MKVLFLDDDPTRHSYILRAIQGMPVELTAVTTADEAIRALDNNRFDLICLDHDLNGQSLVPSGPGTGYEVAVHIARTANKEARVLIHSVNDAGTRKMIQAIGSNAEWAPLSRIPRIIAAALGDSTKHDLFDP